MLLINTDISKRRGVLCGSYDKLMAGVLHVVNSVKILMSTALKQDTLGDASYGVKPAC